MARIAAVALLIGLLAYVDISLSTKERNEKPAEGHNPGAADNRELVTVFLRDAFWTGAGGAVEDFCAADLIIHTTEASPAQAEDVEALLRAVIETRPSGLVHWAPDELDSGESHVSARWHGAERTPRWNGWPHQAWVAVFQIREGKIQAIALRSVHTSLPDPAFAEEGKSLLDVI